MYMDIEKLYADIELDGEDFFVITPEGNYYHFPKSEFDENHPDVVIVDSQSHKKYTVVFNE